jgi:ADP-dependent NAD(P)H-hydrate dehydratase / NAD(P)H-hydrate epimerase
MNTLSKPDASPASHPSPLYAALYTTSEIRSIEAAALARLPAASLMQRAGRAAADAALALLGNTPQPDRPSRVLIVAGPGNNGGDALETAAILANAGVATSVLLLADESRLSHDAAQALQRARTSTARIDTEPEFSTILASGEWSLAIDGLFGIGLTRPIAGRYRSAVELLNAVDCPVLALDVPSGLNADTGAIVAADGKEQACAVRATHTLTFIADKPGLHTAWPERFKWLAWRPTRSYFLRRDCNGIRSRCFRRHCVLVDTTRTKAVSEM